jgi:hypothetical protein
VPHTYVPRGRSASLQLDEAGDDNMHACMRHIPLPHPCTARHAATNQAEQHACTRGSSRRAAQAPGMSNKVTYSCAGIVKQIEQKGWVFFLRVVACIMQCRPAFFLFSSSSIRRDDDDGVYDPRSSLTDYNTCTPSVSKYLTY